MITKKQATLATILYADIFDYPLTRSEMVTWAVKRKGIIPRKIGKRGRFVFLTGRDGLVAIRRERKRAAIEKWAIAQKAANLLRYIPTIHLVGVTGGLAMDNAKQEDDIDLFFIVRSGCLWMSRLLAILAIELLGRRRRRGTTDIKDMICLNMFMTQTCLAIPKTEQNLYVAHEVLQMKPLWDRGDAYAKFLRANTWVKNFLPNAWKQKILSCHPRPRIEYGAGSDRGSMMMDSRRSLSRLWRGGNDRDIMILILRLLERPAKIIQLWYMKKHRTTEIIGDSVLRFHPKDARVWVKRALSDRISRYNVPLDNIFYDR